MAISVDTDISSSLIFELSSPFDSIVMELKNSTNNSTLSYSTLQVQQFYMLGQKGVLLIPLKVPSSGGKSAGNSAPTIASNSISYFKFNYEIIDKSPQPGESVQADAKNLF